MRFAVFLFSLNFAWFILNSTLCIFLGETTADIGRNLLSVSLKLLLVVDCLVKFCDALLLESNATKGVPYDDSRLISRDERPLL